VGAPSQGSAAIPRTTGVADRNPDPGGTRGQLYSLSFKVDECNAISLKRPEVYIQFGLGSQSFV
jgi:hypothetical protein